MSELEDAAARAVDVTEASAAAPSGGKNFELLLEEASKKRAIVLAERKAKAQEQERLASPHIGVRLSAQVKRHAAEVSQRVDRSEFARPGPRATLAFFAAFGFGLGIAAGFSLFSGPSQVAAGASITAEAALPTRNATAFPIISVSELASAPPAGRADTPIEASPDIYSALANPAIPVAEPLVLPATSHTAVLRDGQMAPALPAVALNADASPNSDDTGLPALFVHAPAGITEGRLRAYLDELESAGLEVARVGREGFRVSATHLRFYSDATAYDAQLIAEGLGIEARDFSEAGYATERIELWMAGQARVVARNDDAFVRFLDNLFQVGN